MTTTGGSYRRPRSGDPRLPVSGSGPGHPGTLAGMERIVVRRSGPLSGSVSVPGAKNSVLKLMAAALLADGEYELSNVPVIADADTMADLVRALGLQCSHPDGDRSRFSKSAGGIHEVYMGN